MNKINGQDMKRHNVLLVINTIMRYAPISRTELRDKVGLTQATVINITNDLLDANLIVQEGHTAGITKGRKALILNINSAAFYTIGVNISRESIHIGLADFRGKIVKHSMKAIHNKILPEMAVEHIAVMTERLLQEMQINQKKLLGMGVAAPGPLDVSTGEITAPPDLPNWKSVPLRKMLQERLGLRVCVAKEANAAALAEAGFDNKTDESVFFVALFRHGVGGGLVINGENHSGFHGSAGEVGHIMVDPRGRKCGCGNYGCLEAMISENALLEDVRSAYKRDADLLEREEADIDSLTLEAVFNRCERGDRSCASVVEQAATYLARALGDVILMVSPTRIVVGGPLADMSPQFVKRVFEHIRKRKYPHHCQKIQLEISSFGADVFLQGAVTMVMAQMLPAAIYKEPSLKP